jgi:hypothetical protein
MGISEKLAEALHRINDLVPHREERVHNEIRDTITAETDKPESAEAASEDNPHE